MLRSSQRSKKAQDKFEDLTDKLQRLALITKRWDWLVLSEEVNEEHTPQDFGHSALSFLNAEDWVTYETFLAAFRLWKSAREDALTALNALDYAEDDVDLLPETPWEREEKRERSRHRVALARSKASKGPKRRGR